MEHRLHRLVANTDHWQRPSFGRLGENGFGDFVKENGFGLEDWNFNIGQAVDGFVYGYTRALPASDKRQSRTNIVLAIWDGSWKIVGFYLKAEFVARTRLPKAVIDARCRDIDRLRMAGDLGVRYADHSHSDLKRALAAEARDLCWKVATKDVVICDAPIPIPGRLFDPGRQRLTTSYILARAMFDGMRNLASPEVIGQSVRDALEAELDDDPFFEGRLKERIHKYRERSRALVEKAKRAFKRKHGRLFCQACKFDFAKIYGEDFIEAHHMLPLAENDRNSAVTISDLAMVCANCHRVLHRRRPWITKIEDLPKILVP